MILPQIIFKGFYAGKDDFMIMHTLLSPKIIASLSRLKKQKYPELNPTQNGLINRLFINYKEVRDEILEAAINSLLINDRNEKGVGERVIITIGTKAESSFEELEKSLEEKTGIKFTFEEILEMLVLSSNITIENERKILRYAQTRGSNKNINKMINQVLISLHDTIWDNCGLFQDVPLENLQFIFNGFFALYDDENNEENTDRYEDAIRILYPADYTSDQIDEEIANRFAKD